MAPSFRIAACALLCVVVVACGGGGSSSGSGGEAAAGGGAASGGGAGGGTGGGGGAAAAGINAFLPIDTALELTYGGQPAPARFEPAAVRNSELIAPFRYATGGKEYYVSTAERLSYAGFYSPQVVVADGMFTADARFDTLVTLFRADWSNTTTAQVSGTGTVTILPTYGDRPLTYSGIAAFFGTEAVATPLGSFAAKHVRLSLTVATSLEGETVSVPVEVDYWFARDLGIVQRAEAGQVLRLAAATGPDTDGDGAIDGLDAFPDDGTETRDFDADGTGDNADADDDDDGVADSSDVFPHDAQESADLDHDGIGDNADLDDDGDLLPDAVDPFPRDIHNSDYDGDGTADFYDADDDNDGVADAVDRFPLDATEATDADGDGTGDNADFDDDNDGVADVDDAYPNDPTRSEPLNADRLSLSLAGVFGSAVLPSSFFNVVGDNIAWQATSSAPWLELNSSGGTGDTLVIVSADTSNLAVGAHAATITLTDAGAQRSVEVGVELTVALPQLSVTSDYVTFDGRFGWSELERFVHVSLNTGLASYPVSVAVSFDLPDAIAHTFPAGSASFDGQRLTVSLDPAKLRGGRHTGYVTLTADVKGKLITRDITLEALASERVLYPSRAAIALVDLGTPALTRLSRAVHIRDSYGIAGVPFTAAADQPWILVAPNSVTDQTVAITAMPDGLPPGLHEGTVTIASADPNIDSTRAIRVSLWNKAASGPTDVAVAAAYTQLAADPLRPYVYAHSGATAGGVIDVHNVYDHTMQPSITSVPGTLGPMAVSGDGRWLFVLDPTSGAVTRIDLADPAVRTTWPLTDLKPASQPTTFVYARPNGRGVLFLSDQRVVDAETGSVLPVGALTTLNFDVARSSLEGDRVCVVTTQQSPFTGGCFAMAFSDYETPNVRRGTVYPLDGSAVAGAGFATDLALTVTGLSAIVGMESNVRPAVRFSVLGQFEGPAMTDDPLLALRTARAVAVGGIGETYVDFLEDAGGNERLDRLNIDGSFLLGSFALPDPSVTGMPRQLVVTGDGMGAAYLTRAPQASVSSYLNFQRAY